MDIKKLQTLVVDALEDVKGQDIKVYDTTHLTSLFDRICIASGTFYSACSISMIALLVTFL